MLPLRRNRNFLLLQSGQVLSTIGSESCALAYPLLVLAVTHSPAQAGIVGFSRVLPWALFGLVAGLVVDRVPRKRLMIVCDTGRMLAAASIVVALALGSLTFPQIALVAFVEGTLFVFFNIAEIGAMRSVVPTQQLPAAYAGEQVRYSAVSIAAPPVGGALYGLGRSVPFAGNALAVVFSVASLLGIRSRFEEEREADDAPVREQLAEGLRWLWARPFIRNCALLFMWNNPVFAAFTLVVVVVGRRQGLTSTELGLLLAGLGVASMLGSFAAPALGRLLSMRTIVLGSMWLQVPLALFLLWPSVYVLLAANVPVMLFMPTVNAAVIGYRVALVPDRLTGRVNSVARSLALCAMPLGPLAAGFLLASFSARATVGAMAAFSVVLAAIATANRAIRNAPSLSEIDELSSAPASPAAAG
ncbi:MAG: MFS transporter [Actinobacteria bacterium]|nr:MFS transporter [Actinomycetota bacterium]